MKKVSFLSTVLVLAALGGLALFAAGPISAMPGWSHPGHASPSIAVTEEQREHIRNLHSAYRAALSNLDWRIADNGHAPETMQQARELRMALRAEIAEVLDRGGEVAGAGEGACPYSGHAKPVRFKVDANTLYL